jgi:tetratricopeptide (TPR) repeat protein
MQFDILDYIIFGLIIFGVVGLSLAVFLFSYYDRGPKLVQKAMNYRGPERQRILCEAIEIIEKQLSNKLGDLTNAGKMELSFTLGLAYEGLATEMDDNSYFELALTTIQKSNEYVDKGKNPEKYIQRKESLGRIRKKMSTKGDKIRNLELAIHQLEDGLSVANIQGTSTRRPYLLVELANINVELLSIKKDIQYANVAIEYTQDYMTSGKMDGNMLQYYGGFYQLANIYYLLFEITHQQSELNLSLENSSRALEGFNLMEGYVMNDFNKMGIDLETIKMKNNMKKKLALLKLKIMSVRLTTFLRFAEIENPRDNLEKAGMTTTEIRKMDDLKEFEAFHKMVDTMDQIIERMRNGETYEQASVDNVVRDMNSMSIESFYPPETT